jgi:hypothetical protein
MVCYTPCLAERVSLDLQSLPARMKEKDTLEMKVSVYLLVFRS